MVKCDVFGLYFTYFRACYFRISMVVSQYWSRKMTHIEQAKTLTKVEKAFVKEYLLDFNGTAAYMRATNSSNRKSASSKACVLLKKQKVKNAMEIYAQENLGPHEQTLLGNVRFWRSVRDNDSAKNADRLKASEYLAKYGQMFVEKKEVAITSQVLIVDDISTKVKERSKKIKIDE